MKSMGLLDLPSPLLDAVDHGLAWASLPAGVRVVVYAVFAAWLSMLVYRRWSQQQQLAELAQATAELRRQLSTYDGPFDGLMLRVKRLLKLSAQHLRLSLFPALLAGLPILLVLPWLSNQFSLQEPAPGSVVQIHPVGLTVDAEQLVWNASGVHWDASTAQWQLAWPMANAPLTLRWLDSTLLQLPTSAIVAVIHKLDLPFNLLIANPAGYLPAEAPLDALVISLPARELHPIGPRWLRGWLAVFLISMTLWSLLLRWRWGLH